MLLDRQNTPIFLFRLVFCMHVGGWLFGSHESRPGLCFRGGLCCAVLCSAVIQVTPDDIFIY